MNIKIKDFNTVQRITNFLRYVRYCYPQLPLQIQIQIFGYIKGKEFFSTLYTLYSVPASPPSAHAFNYSVSGFAAPLLSLCCIQTTSRPLPPRRLSDSPRSLPRS